MREIQLTQGKVALVDDLDYEWLNQWKWYAWRGGCGSYYAVRNASCSAEGPARVYMHRLILGLEPGDARWADHINHDGLDNQRCNLRTVTPQENAWNFGTTKGYTWAAHAKKYKAQIYVNGKNKNLGYFDSQQEARRCYLAAKACYHQIGTAANGLVDGLS